jgi:hypothetical protein
MKKNALIVLTMVGFLFGMTASYAAIWVGSYSGNYKPRSGHYEGKIKSVQIGISSQQDSSGKIISTKHNYVYVGTENEMNDNLSFSFSADDLPNGLALMGAIGKNISVTLDLDNNNKLIVQNITVK